ncbi:hypothetical protein ACWCQL_38060, partial [Streptomyces sp. NPDC002073]
LVGMDQAVWTRWMIGGTWTTWQSLGGIAKSKVVIQQWFDGPDARIMLIVKGTDGTNWHRWRWNNGQWSDWAPLR